MLKGAVYRIFKATSDRQFVDVALKKTQEIWTENRYPNEWSFMVVKETLEKVVTKEKVTAKSPKSEQHLNTIKRLNKNELKPMFLLYAEETSFEILQID